MRQALAAMSESTPVLVVDDDRAIREFVGVTLRLAGYRAILVADGEAVPDTLLTEDPKLVVMDVNMPGVSGIEALRRLRQAGSEVPVIMLTARGDDDAKLGSFDAGADDYLIKPFNARELVARVGAVLRRARGAVRDEDEHGQHRVTVGALSLSPREHTASIGDRQVELTRTEYALLLTLARQPGRVFTPPELLSRVWGAEYQDQPEILRTNVYRLRQKLEQQPGEPRILRTRTGVGYYIADD
jgi:DNA-binding response OmpR family regulator